MKHHITTCEIIHSFHQIRTTLMSDHMLIEVRQTLNTSGDGLKTEFAAGMLLNLSS